MANLARSSRKTAWRGALESLEARRVPSTAVETVTPASAEVAPTATADSSTSSDVDPMIYATTLDTSNHLADEASEASVRVPDNQSPSVVGVDVVSRDRKAFGFVVRFSEPMAEGPAEDIRNFQIYRITKTNKWLARISYQDGADNANLLKIRNATYVPEQNAVVVLLRAPVELTGAYRVGLSNPSRNLPARLMARRAPLLTDLEGNPLDPPRNRRGRVLSGPMMFKPTHQIRLDRMEAGSNDIASVLN